MLSNKKNRIINALVALSSSLLGLLLFIFIIAGGDELLSILFQAFPSIVLTGICAFLIGFLIKYKTILFPVVIGFSFGLLSVAVHLFYAVGNI